MTWRDNIPDKASFRGVEFFWESHDTGGIGRRLAKHRYPGKDGMQTEDMGGKDRDYRGRAYVIGDNYMAQRDQLIEALDKQGPGILVHPWFGRLEVEVDDAKLTETTRQGGMASFDLVFVPYTPDQYPARSVDTRAAVSRNAAAVTAAAETEFKDSFTTAGAPAWSVDESRSRLQELGDILQDTTGRLSDLVNSPADLAGGIVGQVQGFINQVGSSLADLRRLLAIGSRFPTISLGTDIRKQQARNQHAIVSLSQAAGVAAGADQLAASDFTSQKDATDALEAISDVIDGIQDQVDPFGGPISDSVYLALQDLRAAVADDIRERGLRLPQVASYTPHATVPALLVAHAIYGDARREEDITQRNNLRHPGFVPGGEPLEVLRDV
jgi:prophage DNA circulation protein